MAAVETTAETSQISDIDSATNLREEPVAFLPDSDDNPVIQTETQRDNEEVVSEVDPGIEKESEDNKKETMVNTLKGILKHEHIYGLDKKTVAFESEVELIPYKKEFAIDIQIVKELTKRVVSYRELFKQKLEEEKSAKDKAAEDDDDDEPVDNKAFSHLLLREPPIHHSTNDTDIASLKTLKAATKQNEKNANLSNTCPQDPSSRENEIEDCKVINKVVEKSKFNVTLVEEFLETNPNKCSDVPINQPNVESIENVIDNQLRTLEPFDNNTIESNENVFKINNDINNVDKEMSSETSISIVNSESLINFNERQRTCEEPFPVINNGGAVTNNSIDTSCKSVVQDNTESVEEFFDCAPESAYISEGNQSNVNEISDVSKTIGIVSPQLEDDVFESFDDQALSSEINYLKQLEVELAALENTIDKLSNIERGMSDLNVCTPYPSCSTNDKSNRATEEIKCYSASNNNPIQLENVIQPTEIVETKYSECHTKLTNEQNRCNSSDNSVTNLTNNNLDNDKVISSSVDELSGEFRPKSSVDIKFIPDELAPDRHLKVTLKCIKEERSLNTQDNTDASDKLDQCLNEPKTQNQTVEETDTDTSSSDLISASDESSVSVLTPLSGLLKCQNLLDFDLSLKLKNDLDQCGVSSTRTGCCVCAPSSSALNETVTQNAGVQTDINYPSHCLQCTCSRVTEDDTPNHNMRSESQLSTSVNSAENDNLATVWELDCQEDKSLTDSTEGNFRDFTQSTNLDCSTSLSMESIELDDTSLRIEMVNGCSSLSEDISV